MVQDLQDSRRKAREQIRIGRALHGCQVRHEHHRRDTPRLVSKCRSQRERERERERVGERECVRGRDKEREWAASLIIRTPQTRHSHISTLISHLMQHTHIFKYILSSTHTPSLDAHLISYKTPLYLSSHATHIIPSPTIQAITCARREGRDACGTGWQGRDRHKEKPLLSQTKPRRLEFDGVNSVLK